MLVSSLLRYYARLSLPTIGAQFGLAIALLGIVAVIVIAVKTSGIGPLTLRAYGITLIATLVTVLSLMIKEGGPVVTAAMGILGAIAGYLFGFRKDE